MTPTIHNRLNVLLGKLNLGQMLALPALRWLLAPRSHFRTGRTHVLAVVTLEAALQNPNCEISIIDHGLPSVRGSLAKAYIKDLVSVFFKDCPGEVKFYKDTICYVLKNDPCPCGTTADDDYTAHTNPECPHYAT